MKTTAFAALSLLLACLPCTLAAQPEFLLTAPSEAGINETFEVRVGGTPSSGDMVRFADSEGNTLGGGEYFNAADEAQLADALAHSVAPSFVISDTDGDVVANGVAGGEPVALLPGEYAVDVAGNLHRVTIEPDKRATLDLDASGKK